MSQLVSFDPRKICRDTISKYTCRLVVHETKVLQLLPFQLCRYHSFSLITGVRQCDSCFLELFNLPLNFYSFGIGIEFRIRVTIRLRIVTRILVDVRSESGPDLPSLVEADPPSPSSSSLSSPVIHMLEVVPLRLAKSEELYLGHGGGLSVERNIE